MGQSYTLSTQLLWTSKSSALLLSTLFFADTLDLFHIGTNPRNVLAKWLPSILINYELSAYFSYHDRTYKGVKETLKNSHKYYRQKNPL